jgi:hypothetical protein
MAFPSSGLNLDAVDIAPLPDLFPAEGNAASQSMTDLFTGTMLSAVATGSISAIPQDPTELNSTSDVTGIAASLAVDIEAPPGVAKSVEDAEGKKHIFSSFL